MVDDAQIQVSKSPAVPEKWILSGYPTNASAVLHPWSQCQVTSVLLERDILVPQQSCTPAVDVRIYYANWTLQEQFFRLDI